MPDGADNPSGDDAGRGHGNKLPAPYYNGLSAVNGSWRNTGNNRLIKAAAKTEFGEHVAETYFKSAPGRCLKQRWLSAESTESRISDAVVYIGGVWSAVWGGLLPAGEPGSTQSHGAAGKGGGRGKGAGAGTDNDEDDDYTKRLRRQRTLATTLLNSWQFLVLVIVSITIKTPLVHFMAWLQKSGKEHRAAMTQAAAEGRTYLGPTPLSIIVADFCSVTEKKMNDLFGVHPSQEDPLFMTHIYWWWECPREITKF